MAKRQFRISQIYTTIKINSPSVSVKSPVASTRPTSGSPSRKRGQETRVAAESEAETSAGKLGSEKREAQGPNR